MDGDELPQRNGTAGPELLLAPEHLAALLTHVDAVVLTFDARGCITFVSASVRELLGYEPADLVGRSAFDFLHEEDAERLVSNLSRWVGRDGATADHHLRVRTAAGDLREVAYEAVTGASVEPFGAGVVTMRAVRGSTSIEQELRRRLVNEDRLTRLVRTFMAAGADFETCVTRALEVMGSLEGVDSVGIWRVEDGWVRQRYQWTAPTIPRTIGAFDAFRVEDFELTRQLAGLREVALQMPEPGTGEAARHRVELEAMERLGAKRFLAVPMVTDRRLSGFVSFASGHLVNIFAPSHRSTLRAAAGILTEAFARHEAQQELQHQARHDSLTGLANRWAFAGAVDDALVELAAGRGDGVALVLFDLDRFHVVNDSLGHGVGDDLLVSVAERLVAGLRADEVLARLGGDELVVLLPSVPSAHRAAARAEELLGALAAPFSIDASDLRVSASVGVTFTAGGSDRSQLLREADAAMYAGKRSGGSRVRLFDAELREQVVTRLEREHDLHGAVCRDELTLHYQPEVDLTTGSVLAVEALLRWQHPRHGLLAAGEFIDVAEESGLIVDIGTWVVDQAMAQLAEWSARSVAPPTMRINLSARQVASDGLVATAVETAARHGIEPGRVCFELTETSVMLDPTGASTVLEGLRSAGFALAIDDFGTGYSSLAYLRQFPVDLVKIDRSFVERLGDSVVDRALVRAIVAMAASLGLPVTAEGIETVEQRDQLVQLGCRQGQGYLLGRPAPPDEVEAVLL